MKTFIRSEMSGTSRHGILILLFCIFLIGTGSAIAQKNDLDGEFQVKGFHLDLRIQVMKPEALHKLADQLSDFGINTLIMEWEGTFPFESHPLIPNRYAYTKEEIKNFVAYCEEKGIDVIPLQQSFGHVEYILRHYRYSDQREDQKDVSQVCPLETEKNKKLFTELFTEMAALHPSPYFHIGGDETYLLGKCDECSAFAEEHGRSKLYMDHIKMLCEIVISLGKRPVLWADIGLKHPESMHELPEGTIFIDWNYGWKLNHFGDVEKLASSGYEVWGAPSLRSSPDNFYISCWSKHFKNFKDFIPAGRELGYSGMVLTSWSTSGIYSTVYEEGGKILDLLPVRHVYPLTAFRISMAAYMDAINTRGVPDQDKFLKEYCRERFGFNKKESLLFWSALSYGPYLVRKGNVVGQPDLSLAALVDGTQKAVAVLYSLSPDRNEMEYAHFRLIMDIRLNYLQLTEIEKRVNNPSFDIKRLPGVISELEVLLDDANKLDEQFIALNEDVYYLSELEAENRNRKHQITSLYERLARLR